MKTVNILGPDYKVIFENYTDNPMFEKQSIDGYCDEIDKKIVICNIKTLPGYEEKSHEYCNKVKRQIMRHEIIHAFLSESGLCHSSL